jgi:Lsr2
MARQVSVELVDDLDGGPAQSTVRFAVDGSWYDIDLGVSNEQTLRAALAPYLAAARPTTARRQPAPVPPIGRTAPGPAVVTDPEPAATQRPQQQPAPAATATPIPSAAFSNPTTPVSTTTAGRPAPNSSDIFTHAT